MLEVSKQIREFRVVRAIRSAIDATSQALEDHYQAHPDHRSDELVAQTHQRRRLALEKAAATSKDGNVSTRVRDLLISGDL